MRIVYLHLKNFIGIYNGLGEKEIKLDIKRCRYKFIIVAGENGSGKSTLIQSCHPFSGMNSDNRNRIIRGGKKGYKEVHILFNKHMYKIKHYYEPTKTSHSIKSYITKVNLETENEIELNENGNVTSFNEHVYNEFGIAPNYLNIIMLGSGMKTFIDNTYSERKNYISQFTSDSHEYVSLYKDVNEKCKYVNNVIKSISIQLDKIGNLETLTGDLANITESISNSRNSMIELSKQLGAIETEINILDPDGNISKEFKDTYKILNSYKYKLNSIDSKTNGYDLSTIDKEIEEIKNHTTKCESEIMLGKMSHKNLLEVNTDLTNRIEEYYLEIDKYQSDTDIEEVKAVLDKYKNLSNKLKCDKPRMTKNDVLNCDLFADNIKDMVDSLHDSYNMDVIENSNINNISEFRRRVSHYSSNIEEYTKCVESLLEYASSNREFYELSLKKPENCTDTSCAFISKIVDFNRKKYEDNQNRLDVFQAELEILKDRYSEYLEKLQCAERKRQIYSNVISMKSMFADFINDNFEEYSINIINRQLPLITKHEVDEKIQIIEKYDEYIDYCEKVKRVQAEYDLLEANDIEIKKYRSRINDLDIKVNEINESIHKYIESLRNLEDSVSKNNNLVLELYDIKEMLNNKKEISDTIEDLETTINKYSHTMIRVEELMNMKEIVSKDISMIQTSINISERKRNEIDYNIKRAKKFKSNIKILEGNYKDLEVVKKALSTNKGIPIVFIRIYLQQTRLIANSLLKNAFNGDLTLDEFEVNEKEFKIPCIGKGERNDDVKSASQGEKALIGLSLTFAFSKQSSNAYNIILLDELDGPLDKKHRKIFLDLLEKQMALLNIEQCFVISHNDAFSSMNSGLILLKNHNMDNYNENNVIYEY